MNVTRNVIKDLLPAYLEGEASADTRRLVEEYLHGDAELARTVETARRGGFAMPPLPGPPPTVEKRALERTRRLLRWRSTVLGLAIAATLFPFSFLFDGGGVRFLLIRDSPVAGVVFLVAAAGLWLGYFVLARRARVTAM